MICHSNAGDATRHVPGTLDGTLGRVSGSRSAVVGRRMSRPTGEGEGGTEPEEVDLGRLLAGLETIIHQLPTALVVMEAESLRVVMQSEQVASIWKVSPSQVREGAQADTSRWVAYFPDGRRYRREDWPIVRTIRTGVPIDGEEMEVIRGDGSHAVIRICSAPLFDSSGNLVAAAASIEDITEQRDVERSRRVLAEASAELVSTLSYGSTLRNVARLAVPDVADWCAVDILNEGGRVERVAVEHIPTLPEDVTRALAHAPDSIHASGGTARVLQTGKPEIAAGLDPQGLARFAADSRDFEELDRWGECSIMIAPLTARGKTIGSLTFVSSRPDRRYGKAELRLAQELAARAALAIDNARLYQESQVASRAKSDFLAVMSHELRTPLTAIIGYAELLALGIPDPVTEPQLEQIERIEASARHLQELIEEVLAVASLDNGDTTVRYEPVQLAELFRRTELVIRPIAREKGLRLVTELPDEPVAVGTDPEKLLQILLNLLSNAVKFTERGVIHLSARADGEFLEIEVRDTGIGFGPGVQERIFEPFWQADQPITRRAGGTGLGLTISRRLVELLGGDIQVRSAPGKGSVFTVRLPSSRRG